MPNDDRRLPPGPGRIAAASRAGHFARSEMFAAGLTLLACAGTMGIMGEDLYQGFANLIKNGITGAALANPDPIVALKEIFAQCIAILGPILLAVLVAGSAPTLVPAILSRKTKGRTVIPLPPIPKTSFPSLVLKIVGILLVYSLVPGD